MNFNFFESITNVLKYVLFQVDYPSTGDGVNPVEVNCNLVNTGTQSLVVEFNIQKGICLEKAHFHEFQSLK